MSGKIDSALANDYDNRSVEWAKWYASSHAKQLNNNRLEFERKDISIESVLLEIAGHASTSEHPWTIKIRAKQERDFQKTVMARLLELERPNGPARILEILTNRKLFDINRPRPRDVSTGYNLPAPPPTLPAKVHRTPAPYTHLPLPPTTPV